MRKFSIGFVCCCVLVSCLHLTVYAGSMSAGKPMVLMVKSSSNSVHHTDMEIKSHQILKAILNKGAHKKTKQFPVSDTHLIVTYKGITTTFRIDEFTNLFDEESNEMIVLPLTAKQKLNEYISYVKSHHYGQRMDWHQASRVIPRKSVFSVIDLETGLQFQVQRRAGSNHADVQPLTQKDTEIMKKIYEGEWSWKRKAIVVHKGDRFLAASMHGMPHGGDGIPGNGFRGHFCIHFLGSSTHGSRHVDRPHQLMVYKAAGELQQYLMHYTPYELVETFFIAVNQKDPDLMTLLFSHPKHQQLESIQHLLKKMKAIHGMIKYEEKDTSNLLELDIPAAAAIYPTGQNVQRKTFTFQFRRVSLTSPWKIDFIENNPLSE